MRMTKWSGLASLLLVAGLAVEAQTAPTPPAISCPPPKPGASTAGKMCVSLRVQNGRVVVAPETSIGFWFAPDFASRHSPRLTLDAVKAALQHDLGLKLARLPMPYVAALAPGETDQSLTDPLTE